MSEIGVSWSKKYTRHNTNIKEKHNKDDDSKGGPHKRRTKNGLIGFKDMKVISDLGKSHFVIDKCRSTNAVG